MIRSFVTLALGAVLCLLWYPQQAEAGHVFSVDCDKGRTIAHALSRAEAGDTVKFTGTCREKVLIDKDDILLRGFDGGMLDGSVFPDGGRLEGLITVRGAQRVRIRNMQIRNAPGTGLLGLDGAAFDVRNARIEDSDFDGIRLMNNTTVNLHNCRTIRNGLQGISLFLNSSAVLTGKISIVESAGNGLVVQTGSVVEMRGTQFESLNNGGSGVDIADSRVWVYGGPESAGTSIVANGNAMDGFFVGKGTVGLTAQPFAGTGELLVQASNNSGTGFNAALDASLVSPFGESRFQFENNNVGMNIAGGSTALVIGGLSVQGNQTGIVADEAASMTLISIPPNPSTVNSNLGNDISLVFGSKATIAGSGGAAFDVGSIVCDETVLLRGSTGVTCPRP
jgi:hypothetical protein